MKIKMIALRRFHYPSGPSGRDYHEGDELEVNNERDAKALTVVRTAKLAPKEEPKPRVEHVTPEPEVAQTPPEILPAVDKDPPVQELFGSRPKRSYKHDED